MNRTTLPRSFSGAIVAGLVSLAASPVSWAGGSEASVDSTHVDASPPLPEFTDDDLVVTPTRLPGRVFDSATPVEVLGRRQLQDGVAGAVTDLFHRLPGVEVSGVGINQARPTIRGQRGQRILLLENGLRLYNPRRERNFGELLALVDVDRLDRVEVVRGPASVLYGSDAIGGVINLITPNAPSSPLGGRVGYRYGDAGTHHRGSAEGWAGSERWSVRLGVAARTADDYVAPAGSFGDVTLDASTRVLDSGGDDRSAHARVAFQPSPAWRLALSHQVYEADTTGFGAVDPTAFGDTNTLRIRYPELTFHKTTATVDRTELGAPWIDAVRATVYRQSNQRRLSFELNQAIGPGATLDIDNQNETDLTTMGTRVEATARSGRAEFVYGFDFVRDDSENTERSETLITGFGPPQFTVSDSTPVPNAEQTNLGVFAQSTFDVTPRASVVLGARWQRASASTEDTPNNATPPTSRADQTVVGSLSGHVTVSRGLALVASVGRGFRSPNLIERFFDGTVAETGGYQRANPELQPETSLNVDLGVRFERPDAGFRADAFVFRNVVTDGIRIAPTGGTVNGQPEFRNENVDELRFVGVEASIAARIWRGLGVSANVTVLDSEDVNEPSNPIGESFENKLVASVTYADPRGRYVVGYDARAQGESSTLDLGVSPIGDTIPSFVVHSLRAGVDVGQIGRLRPRLSVVLENLTDELYAEVGNASFFRPSPGRHLALRWDVAF